MDYIMIKEESTSFTFEALTSQVALPILSLSRSMNKTNLESREAGISRGISKIEAGAIQPGGSIEMRLQPNHLGAILACSPYNSITSTQEGATTAYKHAFMIDDTAAVNTFSMQTQETRDGTTVTYNWRGCVITSITISAEQDSYGTISFDFLAAEETLASTAFGNGDSSPAAITITGISDTEVSFGLPGGTNTLKYGETLSLDGDNQYTGSSGTAFSYVESFEVSVDFGVEQLVFLNAAYPQQFHYGNREVSVSISLGMEVPDSTFYTKVDTHVEEGLRFMLDNGVDAGSPNNEYIQITIPAFIYEDISRPDLSGEHSTYSQEISGRGEWLISDAVDLHIELQDQTTAY